MVNTLTPDIRERLAKAQAATRSPARAGSDSRRANVLPAPPQVPAESFIPLGPTLDAGRFFQVAEFELVDKAGKPVSARPTQPIGNLADAMRFGRELNLAEATLRQVSAPRFITEADLDRLFTEQGSQIEKQFTIAAASPFDERGRQIRLIEPTTGRLLGPAPAQKVERGDFPKSAQEAQRQASEQAARIDVEKRFQTRRRLAGGGARSSTTIRTGPFGVLGDAPVARKVLLGS